MWAGALVHATATRGRLAEVGKPFWFHPSAHPPARSARRGDGKVIRLRSMTTRPNVFRPETGDLMRNPCGRLAAVGQPRDLSSEREIAAKARVPSWSRAPRGASTPT